MNKRTIRELCPGMHSGGTPSTKHPEYWNGNIPWLSSSQSGNDYINNATQFISQEGVDNSSTRYAEKDSVIIATAGEGKTRGQVSYLNIGAYINQSLIAMKPDEKILLPKYLYFYLKNSYNRLRTLSNITGVRGSLSGSLLGNFEISYPGIEQQIKIVNLLAAIDNKIELNKQINRNLEDLAREIYDYWFVQFDFPDKNGNPYKSSGGKMIWNKDLKKHIPDGWDAFTICDLAIKKTDSVNPSKFPQRLFKHYSIPSFDVNKSYEEELGESILSNKLIVEKDDFMVSKLNPWMNRVAIAGDGDDKICSTEYVLLKAKNDLYRGFLYKLLESKCFIEYCVANKSSTSHSHARVKPEVLVNFPFPAKKEIIEKYSKIVNPFLEHIVAKIKENTELERYRNFLLPLLMNGQVSVH